MSCPFRLLNGKHLSQDFYPSKCISFFTVTITCTYQHDLHRFSCNYFLQWHRSWCSTTLGDRNAKRCSAANLNVAPLSITSSETFYVSLKLYRETIEVALFGLPGAEPYTAPPNCDGGRRYGLYELLVGGSVSMLTLCGFPLHAGAWL